MAAFVQPNEYFVKLHVLQSAKLGVEARGAVNSLAEAFVCNAGGADGS
jgi:hypothetical protein